MSDCFNKAKGNEFATIQLQVFSLLMPFWSCLRHHQAVKLIKYSNSFCIFFRDKMITYFNFFMLFNFITKVPTYTKHCKHKKTANIVFVLLISLKI